MVRSGRVLSGKFNGAGIKYRPWLLAAAIQSALSISMVNADEINIQKQTLADALSELSKQTNLQLMFSYGDLKAIKTSSVSGEMPAKEALEILLAGTEFGYKFTSDNTVVVKRINAVEVSEDSAKNSKREIESSRNEIEEMIVTATKRSKSVQDVPLSISAMGAEEIERRGLLDTADYLRSIPGVSFLDHGPGASQITIRGIGINQYEQPTVSSYLGEIPINITLNNDRADLKMVDIERVEILRGPQGTLYGGGAMGGIVRHIPSTPKLDQVEGKLNVGSALTAHSDDGAYNAVGVLNFPLIEDQLALRVVAYRHRKAGVKDLVSNPYIETLAANTGTTVEVDKDVDPSVYTGGRASLLWQPNDRFRATVTLGMQEVTVYEGIDMDIAAGGFQSYGLEEIDHREKAKFDFSNLVLEYDFGWANLTSSSTLYKLARDYEVDETRYASDWAAKDKALRDSESFVQELRLTSQLDGPLQYVAGVYYEEMDVHLDYKVLWVGTLESLAAAGLGSDPTFLYIDNTDDADQLAFFGELQYDFNEQWHLALGSRWFTYDRNTVNNNPGSNFAGSPRTYESLSTSDNDTLFKASLSFTPSEDTLFYTTWSQGFRIGRGQRLPPPQTCDIDGDGKLDFTNAELNSAVDSDSTTNYELGAKMAFMDNRFVANTALYRIDWEDLPVVVHSTSSTCVGTTMQVTVNGGSARTQGVELETQYYLTPEFKLMLTAAYTDTEFLDDGLGAKGQRLPLTPKVNGSLGLEYGFELAGYPAYVRSDYTYVAGFYTDVPRNFPRSGDYGQWNLRTGMTFKQFSVEVYANNLTDEYALMGLQAPNFGYLLPPRIIGVDVGYHF